MQEGVGVDGKYAGLCLQKKGLRGKPPEKKQGTALGAAPSLVF
jgi:hypothetical protein